MAYLANRGPEFNSHYCQKKSQKPRAKPLWWFLQEGVGEAGSGLASLDHFSGLQAEGLLCIVWYLVLG
jgi:hypothetical protein